MFEEERAFRTRIDVMKLRVARIHEMCYVIDMAPTGPGNSCIMTMYIRSRRKGQRMVRGQLRETGELRGTSMGSSPHVRYRPQLKSKPKPDPDPELDPEPCMTHILLSR